MEVERRCTEMWSTTGGKTGEDEGNSTHPLRRSAGEPADSKLPEVERKRVWAILAPVITDRILPDEFQLRRNVNPM
jgi:hypothetical protein